ncbi:MAG: hypothetical protein RMK01_01680 [Thermomicrobium sp.]|nr:hypothetical protein [Thermomicrobium sp.]MDW8058766.1 hypothetical protein [Thermomicrobium sp.]
MRWWFHGPHRFAGREPGEWFWFGLLQTVIGVALLVALVALVVWLVRRTARTTPRATSRARAILDERYARGELTREQYLEIRRDLEGTG